MSKSSALFAALALALTSTACKDGGRNPMGPETGEPTVPITHPNSVYATDSIRLAAAGTTLTGFSRGVCGNAVLTSTNLVSLVTKTDNGVRVENHEIQATPVAVATDCEHIAYTVDPHSVQVVDMAWGNPYELRSSNRIDRIVFAVFTSPKTLQVFGANGVRQRWNVQTRESVGAPLPDLPGVTSVSSLRGGGAVVGVGSQFVVLNGDGEVVQTIGTTFANPRRATYGSVSAFPNGKFLVTLDSLAQTYYRAGPDHFSAPHYLDRSAWVRDQPVMATAATDSSFFVATTANEVMFWHIPSNEVLDLRVRHNVGCRPDFIMEGGSSNQVYAYCASTGMMTGWKRR
jgi:hypothetical protein